MLTTLKHLSSPFEQITTDHFRAAHRRILRRCESLLQLKDAPPPSDSAAHAADAAADAAGLPAAHDETVGVVAAGSLAAGGVAAAGLAGILNERPSGGFLHSLARQLAALEKEFDLLH